MCAPKAQVKAHGEAGQGGIKGMWGWRGEKKNGGLREDTGCNQTLLPSGSQGGNASGLRKGDD